MRAALLLFLAAVCAVAFSAVAHEDHGGAETSEQAVRGTGEVRPGSILEIDFQTHEGEEIAYAFDAAVPVSWNMHEHSDGQVVNHANGTGVRDHSGVFSVPHDGTFSFMVVSYEDRSGRVEMTLEGDLAVSGSSGLDLSADSPAPSLVLLVTLLGVLLWASSPHRPRS